MENVEIKNIIKKEVDNIIKEEIKELIKFIQGNALLINNRIDTLSQMFYGHLYMIITNTVLLENSPRYSKRKRTNAEKQALKRMDEMTEEIKKRTEKEKIELKKKEEDKEIITHKGWIPSVSGR